MQKRIFSFGALFLAITFTVCATSKQELYKSIPCASITDVKKYIQPGCLVASDFDNTLFKEPKGTLSKILYWLALYSQIPGVGFLKPIEPETIPLLQSIEETHTNFIVLTARSIIKQTFNQLKKLPPKPFTFTPFQLCTSELTLSLKKRPAYYKQGILFCCYNNKGEALATFLDALNLKPTKIIFIDDKENNIQNVAKAMESRNIPFVGLRYAYLDKKLAQKKFHEAPIP